MTDRQSDARIEELAENVLKGIEMDGVDIISSGLVYAVVATVGVVRVMINDERFDLEQVMGSDLPDLVQQQLESIQGVVRVVVKPRPKSITIGQPLEGVRHVIGVHSVKGGVGKSTVTAHLALALARSGLKVGLLDADVYGPSVPLMFGVSAEAEVDAETNKLNPVEASGIKLMSIGFMLPDDEPLIWRGNLVDEGMPQMFNEVNWGELDVLLIDMPPGTGDVPIAVTRHAPLSGMVAVTAPSQLSVVDVRRGLEFFADVQVPILGLVENMSAYSCECGEVIPLFGKGAGERLANELGLPLLASLPFDEHIVTASEDDKSLTESINAAFLQPIEKAASMIMATLDQPTDKEMIH